MPRGHFLLALLIVAGCGGHASDPAPDVPPSRVILFGPNLTQTAVRLGQADRVVAITDYCRWPDALEEPPRVGGMIDPDLESIAQSQPDLLVLQGRSEVLRSFATAQGIRLADVKMDDDVESILRGIVRVDSLLTGTTTRGEALVDTLRRELEALRLPVQDDPPSILLVISRDPDTVRNLLTAGAGTFMDDLLRRLGTHGWAADRGRGYFDVSLEELVAHPPDVILEIASAGASDDPAKWREPWVELLGPDVEVVRLVQRDALVPGPGIVTTARELSRSLRQALPLEDPR